MCLNRPLSHPVTLPTYRAVLVRHRLGWFYFVGTGPNGHYTSRSFSTRAAAATWAHRLGFQLDGGAA